MGSLFELIGRMKGIGFGGNIGGRMVEMGAEQRVPRPYDQLRDTALNRELTS